MLCKTAPVNPTGAVYLWGRLFVGGSGEALRHPPNFGNEKLTLLAPRFRKVEGTRMQIFRITLSDGARKFHTAIQAPDAAAAETKAADYFDTSKWQITNVRRAGVVAA